MSRSIAEAAKAAVSGEMESLWHRIYEDATEPVKHILTHGEMRVHQAQLQIMNLSPQERALYEISEE